MASAEMTACRLCPRACGANRKSGQRGRCHVASAIRIARAALQLRDPHSKSGGQGAGAVVISGCPLGCVYCQNRAISRGQAGTEISVERLAEIFFELQGQGANNINLVTAGHYAPQVCQALRMAKTHGLDVPIVWNSSGYETVETLGMLEGLVDVYLPDFKYLNPELAKKYSRAEDYPEVAKKALREMVRQRPHPQFDKAGMMTAGVIVRHLLLPGHVREAKNVVSYLHETYGDQIYISLMNQYTPPENQAPENQTPEDQAPENQTPEKQIPENQAPENRGQRNKDLPAEISESICHAVAGETSGIKNAERTTQQRNAVRGIAAVDPLLARKVTKREYERLLDYAAQIGVEQGFYQEGDTAAESFIPAFDGTGVAKTKDRVPQQ
ncbi:MAG: radical SAM protein [Lachnospiraceae bacterium]|nr:radical SAM protein [Lachnospiraceae bacterium]